MNLMLNKGHAIHAAEQDQHEHGPMVERRTVEMGSGPEHRTGAHAKLKQLLHAGHIVNA